jgi:preprotein translocase subunit SecA
MAVKTPPSPHQLVAQINSWEPKMAELPDSVLPRQTVLFKKRLQGGEKLDDLLPEVFALVREVAKRKLKQRHFDVQLLGGIALHQGKAVEIKTGEGKTLVATLPVYLNALAGKGIHVVTVNEYLARRDALWMGSVYATLGLSVGSIVPDKSYLYVGGPVVSPFPVAVSAALKECSRRQAYRADVTYGVVAEFGFDYLKDNMASDITGLTQRAEEEGGYHFVLLDEVDSILIDEARTPLIIAAQTVEDTILFVKFAKAISLLKEGEDYEKDEELRAVYLTEEGQAKLEKILRVGNLYEKDNEILTFHAEAALKAQAIFTKDRDYIVKNDEIIIVDEFTGRLMYGRRFTEGLHQAIEAKEGVPVKAENKTLASISIQSYFKKYKKLAGMSGTLLPAKKELEEIYGMGVEVIPTNKPMIRRDRPGCVFLTREGKERAIVAELIQRKTNFQPVLLGTKSVEDNERFSQILHAAHLAHQVLNAKNHEQEAGIIAQAGRSSMVTLATNMAGRGVDIILGGNPPDPDQSVQVKESGGLVVIGTERHESKRVDDQLRGRAGRQGDKGESIFFVCLDDELVRIFAAEELEKWKKKYAEWPQEVALPENPSLERLFDEAQKKVETRNAEIRIQLFKYDTFVGHQREAIYHIRRKFLIASDLTKRVHADIFAWLAGISTLIRRYRVSEGEMIIDFARALRVMRPLFTAVSDDLWLMKFQNIRTVREFGRIAQELILREEEKIKREEGERELIKRQRKAYLTAIDNLWMEYMTELDTIRAGIDFVSFAGRDPLDEFKKEADEKFRVLLARIPTQSVENYLKSLV